MNNDLISREALKKKFDEYIKANPNISGIFELGKVIIDNASTAFDCRSCKNNGNERECVNCHDYSNYVHYEERPQGEWICPNCELYEQAEDDYCRYAGECTIGCRECKYFEQKGGAE